MVFRACSWPITRCECRALVRFAQFRHVALHLPRYLFVFLFFLSSCRTFFSHSPSSLALVYVCVLCCVCACVVFLPLLVLLSLLTLLVISLFLLSSLSSSTGGSARGLAEVKRFYCAYTLPRAYAIRLCGGSLLINLVLLRCTGRFVQLLSFYLSWFTFCILPFLT